MIEDLVELGIIFDISNGEISLTTEGGHSFAKSFTPAVMPQDRKLKKNLSYTQETTAG